MKRWLLPCLALTTVGLPCSLALGEGDAIPSSSASLDEKKGEDEKKETWNVDQPPLPTYEIEIEADEGTWMSLDVSPQGDEILFDLLGDLYRLSIDGGEAKALTQGLSWDMQPRYSPDGRHIAFTSDRGGGDNIWIMDRDGSNPRAVTQESFRLLNSPVWSPDGQYLAARKHFTAERSLGSGEIWLYHRSGGEGVQMTSKPNEEKDVGEPAFSADGRYLYFSQDLTAGDTFQYNKDSNDEIYGIRRLDRDTGELEDLVGGAGGAIRPTPSPDGRFLAFVRRVRFVSTLFLRDLESGAETAIYSPLDRDLQETWAIHGVYPAMAWTPDSRSLVFWSQGKIHRLEVESRQVQEIPFRVRATHTMVEALRFPQDPGAENFRTRMLRWVQVSPDGSRVIFQTLGHLYLRQLPDGEPQRLTAQSDHFEFFPSFSRDGKWIVYVTWNDQSFGSVRVAPATGGEGRIIVAGPGHFSEPAISPDGSTVVYNKLQGGWLRPPTWSAEPGIYRVPFAGGEPLRIVDEGSRPSFGAASDRVYLQAQRDEDKRALVSIGLDGTEPRTHLLTDWASEFSLSPNGEWVAFTERFNAYVAPFPRTGKEITLGPDSKNLPLHKVSRDAGRYLHWSGDSRRLYWTYVPEIFPRNLPEVFTFLEGAPEEPLPPPESGLDLGFQVTTYAPQGILALVGGRLVTMTG